MFDYEALRAAGFETIVIEYSGSNDEGWINTITPRPFPEGAAFSGPLCDQLEREAYDLLASKHGGWEINEGSTGTITINVKEGKTFIHHGEHYQRTNWFDSEV